MSVRKPYAEPMADLVELFGDIRADKLPGSMNGTVVFPDHKEDIGIDNGDHTGPDGSWNGDLEIE